MELILDNIYKSYGSLPVLSGVSMKIASPVSAACGPGPEPEKPPCSV